MGTTVRTCLYIFLGLSIFWRKLSAMDTQLKELQRGNSSEIDGNTAKSMLRYGFQNTHGCQDFKKAFLCVRKCLDLRYDVAHSDRNCKCTCYHKPDKGKMTPSWNGTRTRWKLGAPTTSKPIWAQPSTEEPPTTVTENTTEESVEAHGSDTDNEEEEHPDEGEDADADDHDNNTTPEAGNETGAPDDADAHAEGTPAEEAHTEEGHTEVASAEDAPAEEAPAEENPAEEAPAEEKPAEEAPAEEKPAEEVTTEEPSF